MEIQEWKRLGSISTVWNVVNPASNGTVPLLGRTNRTVGRKVEKVRGQVSYGIIAEGRRFMELKNVLCFEITETIDPKTQNIQGQQDPKSRERGATTTCAKSLPLFTYWQQSLAPHPTGETFLKPGLELLERQR